MIPTRCAFESDIDNTASRLILEIRKLKWLNLSRSSGVMVAPPPQRVSSLQ